MMEVGRVCVKLAGRDAGKKCVVIEAVDDNFVIIDGQMKRGRCNVRHLEPMQHLLELESGASHDAVVDALKSVGVEFPVKKTFVRKPKASAAEKPAKKQTAKAKTE